MSDQQEQMAEDLAALKTLVQRHIDNDHRHLQRAIEGEPVRDLSGNVIRHKGGLQGDIKDLKSTQTTMANDLKTLAAQNGTAHIKLTKGQMATATAAVGSAVAAALKVWFG